MMEIIGIALLCIPTIYEATVDYFEWKKGERDKKSADVIIRSAIMSGMSAIVSYYILPHKSWLDCFLLSGAIFLMFFDYIMGYLLTKSPSFLGTTSILDRFLSKMKPIDLFLLRGLVFVAAVLLYFKI